MMRLRVIPGSTVCIPTNSKFSSELEQNTDLQLLAGYPQFSRWVASDQAWFITRRFGTLNARIILLLQDNIVKLEDELNMFDKAYSRSRTAMNDNDMTHNGSFRLESFSNRAEVLEKLVAAVSKYCKSRERRDERPALIFL